MSKRVWIIDAAYLFHSSRASFQFDYKRMRDLVEKDGELLEAHYLNSTQNPPTDQQDSFHSWLKTAPPRGPKLQVHLYELKDQSIDCPNCAHSFTRQVQKGVDVGIATLALTLIDRYDTLILSSGDGDFLDALKFIRNVKNKRLELAVFHAGVSADLQSLSDKILWLDEHKSDIEKIEKSLPVKAKK